MLARLLLHLLVLTPLSGQSLPYAAFMKQWTDKEGYPWVPYLGIYDKLKMTDNL